MDNSLLNIRVLSWHFKIIKRLPFFEITYNEYHKIKEWPDGYFSVYRLWPFTF